ncbi:MAG TPA: hypothetical protein VER33_05930 [Polyangiaceae bacterium]|nr:hypothetical protein [Polyangiaceae bacterium]
MTLFKSKPLSAEVEALLAIERDGLPQSEDVRCRAVARARAALVRPSTPPAPPRLATRTLAGAFAVLALAAVSAAAIVTERRASSRPPALAGSPSAAAPAPRAARVQAAREALTEPPAVSQASADERAQALAGERERRELSPPVFAGGAERSRKTSARSLPVSAAPLGAADYARELQVLQPARAAVKRGDFTAALAAISEHRRRFGNGQLVEEREALRVRALAGLNRSAEARRAAEAFRKRFPHSVLQSGMKQLVESPP